MLLIICAYNVLLCCYTANPDEEMEGALLLITKPDLIKVCSLACLQVYVSCRLVVGSKIN